MAGRKARRKKAHPTLRFLVMARTGSGRYPHPVEVGLYPDGAESIVSFSIGPHVVNAGGLVRLAFVIDEPSGELNPVFQQEFDAAELHWLVPYLVRLLAREDVTEEIVAAYQARHGKRPESMHIGRPRV
ncbi:hypothetical protein [Glycomyces paridis]|uniref:Uncharacterized protein n=1 Tax=Glycomyces paridis TaxID=2126555 RepID=A0A4S8P2D8_9ACTN|nr:hypothetical protein [Glycomyces paridis]THV24247.1 hypothetical protein E9998_21725 [Glycomyces paridis]